MFTDTINSNIKIMALLKNASPKGDIRNSGYFRVFDDEHLALMIQKVQSTVITNGTELEHFIEKFCPYRVYKTEWTNVSPKTGKIVKTNHKVPNTTPTLSSVFEKYNAKENCFFPKIKISKEELMRYGVDLKNKKNIELDGIWVIDGVIYIVEMKDGSDFDTKKSDGEIEMFKKVEKLFSEYNHKVFIVLWNLNDINDNSVKSLEAKKYLTTGYEFSKMVGLNFDNINNERKKDCVENKEYFIKSLMEYYNATNI